ncbi:hypothetical protein AALP_AA6G299200 [Arabis alpina]|uniref:Uncharacterized protein n=1 Tax=Arabis alpina TaxID=50452 RepID=A0A087GSM7_ARAAL|nr:hypothetical protein AALP_AA6G299200 [Arabis alpina]
MRRPARAVAVVVSATTIKRILHLVIHRRCFDFELDLWILSLGFFLLLI